jgi:hypothetical protein
MTRKEQIDKVTKILKDAKVVLKYLRLNDHVVRSADLGLEIYEYEEEVSCIEKDLQDIKRSDKSFVAI